MATNEIGCLTCRKRIAQQRGCCVSCYQTHWLAVKRGRTTWADLEASGLTKPRESKERRNQRNRNFS